MGRTIYRSLAANISLTLGVFLGIKAADKLMWNPNKYEAMKETLEIDYWKKYGEPKMLKPELQKSSANEAEFYETWLKDKRRAEYMEEKVYKLH
jgi:hypothetical protein